MTPELVSVIIPTYNRGFCVARAIDSALAQTNSNVEVLVIDDGSTDNSAELIQSGYSQDPRVRYFYQDNQGVSEARNTGIRNVRGEFVALLDSDDLWHPWKLEAQLAAFRRLPDVGMIWTDLEAIGPDGTVSDPFYLKAPYEAWQRFTEDDLFPTRFPLLEVAPQLGTLAAQAQVYAGDIFSQMIAGNLVRTSTVVLRRERVERVGYFNPELRFAGEDYDFHLRTCREGKVGFINVSSIQYQRGLGDHLGSATHELPLALNFLNTITPFIESERHLIHLSDQTLQEILTETHQWIGEAALNTGNVELARRYLGLSLRENWKQPRSAALFLVACLPQRIESAVLRRLRYWKSKFEQRA